MNLLSNPLVAISWVLLGVILMGFYNALLLVDNKTNENDPKNIEIKNQWHFVGGAIFIYLSLSSWIFFGWEYVLFSLASFWLIFAGIVHDTGLEKPFFYVGTTAKTDRLIRYFFPRKPELASAILKIVFMIISILIIIYF